MQTDMTEDHRTQLQQIQQRDKELDARYLDQIEKGVEDLRDIALRANEVGSIYGGLVRIAPFKSRSCHDRPSRQPM